MSNYLLPTPVEDIYTVSQLNRETSLLLANHFMSVWVQGEISNLSRPASGHIYFSLKDADSQIRCALFKTHKTKLIYTFDNGKQVLIKAKVSLYEPRGDYQLIVEYIQEAGGGLLRAAFEQLKLRLSAQGLFDPALKKPIPTLPNTIGIITSPSGAAIRDILSVLKRRFPAIPVIIYPAAVQGEAAKYEISTAIARANDYRHCDVLILARGGGSIEDLWAFNEEMVARAVFDSHIPIITGIGHETDFTIADYVADFRAPTPSAAAEQAVPDQHYWATRFMNLESSLAQQFQRRLQHRQQQLNWLDKRLQQQHPEQQLFRNAQRLDELELRLARTIRLKLAAAAGNLHVKQARLAQFDPGKAVARLRQHHGHLAQRLSRAIKTQLAKLESRLNHSAQTLHAISPLATLQRGYALVINPDSEQIVRSSTELVAGQQLDIRLGSGQFAAKVIHIDPEPTTFSKTPE